MLDRTDKAGPVMGHRLRQFHQLHRQVGGVRERDAELAGCEPDGDGRQFRAGSGPVLRRCGPGGPLPTDRPRSKRFPASVRSARPGRRLRRCRLPRVRSSGNQRRLGRISKRGDRYLRTLLIHGGRSVLWRAHKAEAPSELQQWGVRIHELRGHNKAALALANKLARRVWAVWKRDCDYQGQYRAA